MKDNQGIVCYSKVLWNMLQTGAKLGAAPLNVAIHLKKQGTTPHLVSKVGNHENEKCLIKFLKQSEIDTDFIQFDEELPTSTVQVHLDKKINTNYEICEPVVWNNISLNEKNKISLNFSTLQPSSLFPVDIFES